MDKESRVAHLVDPRTMFRICRVLERCGRFFSARDEMNAAIHNSVTIQSQMTSQIQRAIGALKERENWLEKK